MFSIFIDIQSEEQRSDNYTTRRSDHIKMVGRLARASQREKIEVKK
jgi:hypothetical protein